MQSAFNSETKTQNFLELFFEAEFNPMIEINQAVELIVGHTRPLDAESITLAESTNRTLAQNVVSDVDSPPYDKSIMDGFAVRAQDIVEPNSTLSVVETILAGHRPQRELAEGEAARIMTGAPLPIGADCIVMIENTTLASNNHSVVIHASNLAVGHHLMRVGTTLRKGDVVFQRGHRIRPHDLGLLAEVGAAKLSVNRQPNVAVLATGNELVEHWHLPSHSQIRNSNGPMLMGLAQKWSNDVSDLGIALDDRDSLRAKIVEGLQRDILILSGGVSAGLADLVPSSLAEQGAREIFHQVNIKPGKPIWFGVADQGSHRCHIFGLPGNPVSTLVCFHQFVTSCFRALDKQSLDSIQSSNRSVARLTNEHSVRGPRCTYWPVRLSHNTLGQQLATPLDWKGSSDLNCLAATNALAILPPNEVPYPADSIVDILSL